MEEVLMYEASILAVNMKGKIEIISGFIEDLDDLDEDTVLFYPEEDNLAPFTVPSYIVHTHSEN